MIQYFATRVKRGWCPSDVYMHPLRMYRANKKDRGRARSVGSLGGRGDDGGVTAVDIRDDRVDHTDCAVQSFYAHLEVRARTTLSPFPLKPPQHLGAGHGFKGLQKLRKHGASCDITHDFPFTRGCEQRSFPADRGIPPARQANRVRFAGIQYPLHGRRGHPPDGHSRRRRGCRRPLTGVAVSLADPF